jgi:hypothetical protein
MRPVVAAALLIALSAPVGLAREFIATEADFQCLTEWKKIDGHKTRIFNHNPRLLKRALRILAKGKPGRRYPVGTIIELVPPIRAGSRVIFGEASVKRGGSFNRAGNGWEFFLLNIRPDGSTEVADHGAERIANTSLPLPVAPPPCQTCHSAAKKFDLVCESGHGCAPLPINLDATLIEALQTTDARCAAHP